MVKNSPYIQTTRPLLVVGIVLCVAVFAASAANNSQASSPQLSRATANTLRVEEIQTNPRAMDGGTVQRLYDSQTRVVCYRYISNGSGFDCVRL